MNCSRCSSYPSSCMGLTPGLQWTMQRSRTSTWRSWSSTRGWPESRRTTTTSLMMRSWPKCTSQARLSYYDERGWDTLSHLSRPSTRTHGHFWPVTVLGDNFWKKTWFGCGNSFTTRQSWKIQGSTTHSGSWSFRPAPSTGKTSSRGHASTACNSASGFCTFATSIAVRCSSFGDSCQSISNRKLGSSRFLRCLDACNAGWDARARQERMHTSSKDMGKSPGCACYAIILLALAVWSTSTRCRSWKDMYVIQPDAEKHWIVATWTALWFLDVDRLTMLSENWHTIDFYLPFNVKGHNHLRPEGGNGQTWMGSSMTNWLTW